MSEDRRDRFRERERTKRVLTKCAETTLSSHPIRERSPDRGKAHAEMKPSLCRVYVSNLPDKCRWQHLKDVFRNRVGDVSYGQVFVDANNKRRDCGIVEFCDPASVKKCLEVMDGFVLRGVKLVVEQDFANQRDKYGNEVGTSASKLAQSGVDLPDQNNGVSTEISKWGNIYGFSPQFLESLKINLPLINRVYIANLNNKVDKKKLKEVFKLAGKVQEIDFPLDKDGKNRGFAVVVYDYIMEAVQAISMFNHQILYDCPMVVRMDRGSDRTVFQLPDGLMGVGKGLGLNGEPLRVSVTATNTAGAGKSSGEFFNEILITNLPPLTARGMLNEKLSEFGDVQHVIYIGKERFLVAFATASEAECAIKNMDGTCIDGRTIGVKFFY